MSRRSRLAAGWLAGVCLVVTVGCGTADSGETETESESEGDPSVPFATHDQEWNHDAVTRGTVVLQDGCVYLEELDTQKPVVLIFPDETNWDESTQTVTLNERSAEIGERIVLSGGRTDGSVANYIPDGCEYAEDDELFIVGAISPPEVPE